MYGEIYSSVKRWLQEISLKYQGKVKITVKNDSPGHFGADVDTDRCFGELIVSEGGFRPYRYVSFTVLDSRADTAQQPVFVYFDSEKDTPGDVLRGLDKGIAFIITDI